MTDDPETDDPMTDPKEADPKEADDQEFGPDGEARTCTACQKPFVPEDAEQTVCVECQEWRRALVVVGLFLLFFCFVALPLLVQLLNTPRP